MGDDTRDDDTRRWEALSTRLRQYATQLRCALRDGALDSSEQVFAQVVAVSSEALDVRRASVWLVDGARGVLTCQHLFVRGQGTKTTSEINLRDVASYVRALTTDVLAVEDVTTDPRLLELVSYCAERDIRALLDTPIVLDGEVVGVICHEHVGGARAWHDAEIEFAANLGSLVALAIEAERRQQAQRRALAVEASYRQLVENMPVVIYSFDLKTGNLGYISPAMAALTGYPAADIVRGGIDGWIARLAPDDRDLVRARMRAGVSGALATEISYRLIRPDGTQVWLRDICAVIRSASGRVVAVQGTLQDITAERSAELRQQEAERRYRQLIDHVDLLGVVLDARGTIVLVNDAWCRLAGISREQAIGGDGLAVLIPEGDRDEIRTLFERAVAGRQMTPRWESTIRTASGEHRQIVWTNSLLFAEDGAVEGIASLGLDMTDRNRLEQELAQQRKFESLGRMAASVAHDFNNVLTVLSLSLAHGGKRAEIATSMAYASELVTSLLAYARREPIAVQDVDVDRAIAELTPVLATAIGKDLRLELELHAGERSVRISPTELRQLIVNLVTNAAEATRDHGRMIRIASDLTPDGSAIEMRVADDGRGMDAATAARAFDPFFTTKPPGKGTGIGLATCHSIVTRAAGTITVDSRPSHGTTFHIRFPISQGVPALPRTITGGHAAVEERRVLLVEDSRLIGDLVEGVLREAGYSVVHVATVAAALDAIAASTFGIVITDLQLPDGRGDDVISAARTRSRRTVIVVSSGEPTVLNGVDGVLAKPFSPTDLQVAIDRAVEHRRGASA